MGPAEQFQSLLARAVSKYERLRDVPTHSVHDLSSQYAKAFQAFSQTWEYLQTNRRVLVEAGLKRSDIGELAAKIGHLHFNWYLRCADTRFLVESYIFYEAIHARQYYQEHDLLHDSCMLLCGAPSGTGPSQTPGAAGKPAAAGPGSNGSTEAGAGAATGQQAGTITALSSTDSEVLGSHASSIAEQQLRYYARFILVCIMLGNKEEAVNLLQEFQALVAAYTMSRGPGNSKDAGNTHHGEWQLVLAEVVALLTADPGMPLPRSPGAALSFRPCCRANPTSMEAHSLPHTPRIHHAVLVGYHHRQVKLAELSVDVLRMMQALEWHDERIAASEGLVGLSDAQHSSGSPGMVNMMSGASQGSPSAEGSRSVPAGHQQRGHTGMPMTTTVTALGGIIQHAPLSSIPERSSPGTTPDAGLQHSPSTSPEAKQQGPASPAKDASNEQQSVRPAAATVAAPTGLPPLPPQHVQHPVQGQQQPQRQQQQPSVYLNPPRTLLYRTTAPAVLCALHGAAASLPADARRILFLYLSAGSVRNRMNAAASHSGTTPLHMQGGRLLPAPVARLPAVPSTSCLTSSLLAAAASSASLKDASGVDLGGAWCLSPPPPQKQQAGDLGRGGTAQASSTSMGALTSCALRVEELRPLTRHRLLVVADGDVACELRSLVGSELAYPLLALMSPRHRPSAFGDAARTGQLFTLFLTLPVSAFCLIMGEQDPPPPTLHALQDAVEESLGCIANALHQAFLPPSNNMRPTSLQTPGNTSAPAQPHPIASAHASSSSLLGSPLVSLLAQATAGQGTSTQGHGNNNNNNPAGAWLQHPEPHSRSGSTISEASLSGANTAAGQQTGSASAWALPFQDVLLRQLMCRFILARAALAYHRASTGRPECQADCTPEMPVQLSPSSPVCVEAVLRIATVLRRQALFEGHVTVCAAAAAASAAGGPMSQPAPAPAFQSVSTSYLPTPQGSAGPGTAEGAGLLATQLQGGHSSGVSLGTAGTGDLAAAGPVPSAAVPVPIGGHTALGGPET